MLADDASTATRRLCHIRAAIATDAASRPNLTTGRRGVAGTVPAGHAEGVVHVNWRDVTPNVVRPAVRGCAPELAAAPSPREVSERKFVAGRRLSGL